MLLLRAHCLLVSSAIRSTALRNHKKFPFHTKTMPGAEGRDAFAANGAAELRERQPGPCSKDTPLLKEEERTEGLKSIPAWKLNEKSTEISRAFVAKNFLAAIDFFQRVAEIAEEANHHPDLHLTDYRNVKDSANGILPGAILTFEKLLCNIQCGGIYRYGATDRKVVLSTHAAGGLTAQDLIIAARIDFLPVDYSPKWIRQQLGRE